MKGFDISDDELAKSHARYMVGGRTQVPNERMFRFGMWSHTLRIHAVFDRMPSCRIPRTAWRTPEILGGYPCRLEHQLVPLP